MWSAKLTIINNTNCTIEVQKENVGKIANIKPNTIWDTTTKAEMNVYMYNFWQESGALLMSGNCRFGSKFGVLVERGWIYEGPQIVKMVAVANGKEYIQTENGGRPLLNWNEFEQGGEVTLTFDNI
jgi:hypothetical protein